MELIFDNKKKSIKFSGTISELLQKLEVSREEVVIKLNGKLAPETTKLKPRDKVEVIKVVFGG